jgi:hypothetical protein
MSVKFTGLESDERLRYYTNLNDYGFRERP